MNANGLTALNKLAILAFSILVMLSALSWYLAKGSLNDYLKSQVILQGQYYSDQQARVNSAILNEQNGKAVFESLHLTNLDGYQAPYVLTVNKVHTSMASPSNDSQPQALKDGLRTSQIITLADVTIDTLTVFVETRSLDASSPSDKNNQLTTNIDNLLNIITVKLATDYPVLYPELAAKLYAQKHPELRSDESIHKSNAGSDSNTFIDSINEVRLNAEANNQAVITAKAKKKRKQRLGKAQTRIAIQQLNIEKFMVKMVGLGQPNIITVNQVELGAITDANGLASNQVGGEILRLLLTKAQQIQTENNRGN